MSYGMDGSLVPNTLGEALKKRPKDFNFNKAILISVLVAYPLLFFPLIYTVFVVRKKIKINEYYASEEFLKLKKRIEKNTKDINELNQHIEDLKHDYTRGRVVARGKSSLVSGGYNYKRSGWSDIGQSINTYNCSLQVVKNSGEQPFKYVCKYFDIKPNEENLERFEELFNNYSAAAQGQVLLLRARNEIFAKISEMVPMDVIKYTPNRLVNELGFDPVSTEKISFPKYNFIYVSAGGNSVAKNTVEMDLENMEDFIGFLSAQIKWRASIAGQRALMTAALREKIKERDGYACKKCGASVEKEPNLLLEIDHIKPLAKGGKTTESNLQTLCWRCNRRKGAKLET